MTGCVYPPIHQQYLVITDSVVRLEHYLYAINYYISKTKFRRIIFCDNSDCQYNHDWKLYELAKRYKKQFEWLSFSGDTERTAVFGKGYGEGEIIEYALVHSQLLQDVSFFYKVTGRLKINNVDKIINRIKTDREAYFNIDIYRPRGMDTRFFACSTKFYKEKLVKVYLKCDDRKGAAMEDLFFSELFWCANNLPLYPDFRGQSAGSGRHYEMPKTKRLILDIFCMTHTFNKSVLKIKDVIRKMREKKAYENKSTDIG